MFRTIAAATAITVACGLGAAPALAAAPSTPVADATPSPVDKGLDAIKAAGANAIDRRLTSLNTAMGSVNNSTRLTDSDKQTILGTLTTDVSGLTTLKSTLAADTTLAAAKSDYQAIFTTYRVYAVAIPQSLEAAAADAITGAMPKLQDASQRLSDALAKSGKSTPELQSTLDDLNAKLADAQSLTDGLSAAALAVTPSAYNADHTVLSQLRTKLVQAAQDLRAAVQDGRTVLEALR